MRKIFRFIGLIFKSIWKTINFLRLAVINLFFIIIIALIYLGYTQTTETPEPKITQASPLMLNLSGPIVEQKKYIAPMESLTGSLLNEEMPKENLLFDIVDTLRYAKTDANISGLILNLQNMPETGLTKLRYIAKAINEFKTSGKPVYAVGGYYSQSQYYLASYADKIYMAPDGGVMLQGYGTYTLYYKSLLEKLDINTHVFRVGTYKSAIEPFIRDNMSEAAKESASVWLTQLWGAYVDDVAKNRHIDAKVITPSMDELLRQLKSVNGNLAALTQKQGLIDELVTRQQFRAAMADAFGTQGKDSYRAISYYDYLPMIKPTPANSDDDIAVIVASGTIRDGEQPRGTIGSETLSALIRQAKNDEHVKAVVLRLNTPGGSSFASEVIRNEIEALQASGKPVVVSMSGVTASGGYWISAGADKIVAQPTTLTGSIGIFGVFATVEKGLSKLGIHSDGVGTTPFAGLSPTRNLSDKAGQAIQMNIEYGYQRFIRLVGEGRDMSPDAVNRVAQGRVWTGYDAMKAGLVDQMGDFDDAVALAAELAQLDSYNLLWVEEPLSASEQLLLELADQIHASLGLNVQALLPESLRSVSQQLVQGTEILSDFNDPKGIYALCLTCQTE
ncbi:signal peptide peptidase SppA [Vibrio sp. HA2012]|uniref:signal peptide peptidase SppA n=1 Tax=Vibrio sp. HA2012 TaxID=1971595 RepID=UPI000C2C5C15|nr:signal peptide peptidase SppA [Vibrio sp. HA2012]PJC88211.1 signal peptide peptidase SppA [Vibrio sp. HA2012]